MESLGYFLLWAGIFFILMRLGRGAHAVGDGPVKHGAPEPGLERDPKQLGWVAPKTAVDPLCGKSVQTGGAKSSVNDGAVYYFCSRECRERFEAAPSLYLGQPPEALPEPMSHDHG